MFGSSHQLFITIGSLAATFVGLIPPLGITKEEARDSYIWRIGFSASIALVLIQVLMLIFVYRYESPAYYISKGDVEKATRALTEIYSNEADAREVLKEISEGNEVIPESTSTQMAMVERTQKSTETTSLYSKYKKAFWIGLIVPALQQLSGINAIVFYSHTIFKEQTNESTARILSIVVMATNVTFTVVSTFTSDKLGRRVLFIAGSIGCGIGLFVAGLSLSQIQDKETNTVSGFSLIFDIAIFFFVASFGLSHGPIW
jgi:SP family arabinose:H+ symporter-like MFS transporter